MSAPESMTITMQIRIRRLWLLRLSVLLWSWLGWLFPFVDPDALADTLVRLTRAEYREGHGRWRPLPWEPA